MAFHLSSERRGDESKHRSVRKGANEEGKRAHQIQSYAISWLFRLTVSGVNCDIPIFKGEKSILRVPFNGSNILPAKK